MSIIQPHNYVCKFCEKHFTKESWYLSHQCKEMHRDQQLNSPIGQSALQHYIHWMVAQRKSVVRKESFLESKYFNSMYRFAEWARTIGVPDTKMFINYMVQKQISPVVWTNDEIYSMFIEYYDANVAPIEQARIAVETIQDLSDVYEVPAAQLFDVIDVGTLITKIRQRKLSPWILLNSGAFKKMYSTRLTEAQRITLEMIVRPEHWAKVFKTQQDTVTLMKTLTTEMRI